MIIGHQLQWQYLKRIAEMGQVPHAFLFSGEEKIGKRKIAIEFAKILLGSQNQDIEKRVHPDLIFIEPKSGSQKVGSKKKNQQIQISQIRELNSYFNFRSFVAPFKIAIIDGAHCMRQDAQSSFLKLLEEPRGKALFILITPFPKMLLPTIISRIQIIKFYKVPDFEIKKYLQARSIPEKTINEIISFCEGKPGRIMDFLADPQRLKAENERIQEIIELMNSDLVSRFQYAESLSKNPQNLGEVLEIWIRYLRKILLVNIKREDGFKQYSLPKLKKIINLTQKINFLISTTNVNSRLALEILMLEL